MKFKIHRVNSVHCQLGDFTNHRYSIYRVWYPALAIKSQCPLTMGRSGEGW